MSVIMKDPYTGKIKLYCKGADNVISNLLNNKNPKLVKQTNDFLEQYAQDGLRTLLIAEKEIGEVEYREWSLKYKQAQAAVYKREEQVEEVCALIERDLDLVGSTAIEDKL